MSAAVTAKLAALEVGQVFSTQAGPFAGLDDSPTVMELLKKDEQRRLYTFSVKYLGMELGRVVAKIQTTGKGDRLKEMVLWQPQSRKLAAKTSK